MHGHQTPLSLALWGVACEMGWNLWHDRVDIRVSFRIFVKGGGKHDNSRVKGGGRDYSMFFPSVKNDVVLINFIILGGGLRQFLVASEHSDGESLSVIPTGCPLFQIKCYKDVGCVSYRM